MDIDLRNELDRDVERLRTELGPVTGIFVSGDIAFAGQEQEFERARQWLTSLTTRAGCPEHRVWMVPGNHDVDRASIANSHLLQSVHTTIRRSGTNHLDDQLARWATDLHAGPVLLAPLNNYNSFAQLYDCSVTVSKLSWSDDLVLNDGSTLRLWGATSALISDNLDDDGQNRLLLGRMQMAIPREPGVEYLLICHHPPDWLLDRDAAEDFFKRARIQLFGHKHQQRLSQIDDCLRLTAGAVHPERAAVTWEPRYNLLEISVASAGDQRTMQISVYPRVWSAPETRFGPDILEKKPYELPLPSWQPSIESGGQADLHIEGQAEHEGMLPSGHSGGLVDANRRLVYRFCELAYVARIDVARELGLLADDDRGITDLELNRRILRRARERALLQELWDAVAKRNPEPTESNPFAQ